VTTKALNINQIFGSTMGNCLNPYRGYEVSTVDESVNGVVIPHHIILSEDSEDVDGKPVMYKFTARVEVYGSALPDGEYGVWISDGREYKLDGDLPGRLSEDKTIVGVLGSDLYSRIAINACFDKLRDLYPPVQKPSPSINLGVRSRREMLTKFLEDLVKAEDALRKS